MRAKREFISIALAALLATGGVRAQSASLVVQVDRPGVKISPMLYGLFFEEINCAGDGGIYAELVRNRSFEDADQPAYWSLIGSAGTQGSIAIDTDRPLSEKNRSSLRLHIADARHGRVGVANHGYWGVPITRGAQYALSLYARCGDGFEGPLMVSIQGRDGTIHAQQNIEGLGAQWREFTLSLTADATDPTAMLVLSASCPGTVWLDMVSLFPVQTWKNRPNGLRPDLANMLDELRTAFVRFPGGCWVEGNTLATSYRWKQTIGEIKDRRGQWNVWNYQCTNGLGFHEYLQMCEDLRAEPLFVINCGMSHRETVPLDKMNEWVQDALDAIEYANGPTDSTWGAMRTRTGHRAPFNLKYMEIGNENGGPAYNERYALFYDAIKARYPSIHIVANQWNGRPSSRPIEILDEHYYADPTFFMTNADRYDKYDRKGPGIYVGEYAVTQGCGQGNLRAAIAEAAFMTGLERNSDVVVMASYAPLFANVNHRAWTPDLINFDGTRGYGTPSYYVQKMFGTSRGDVVLPLTVTAPSIDLASPPAAPGAAAPAPVRVKALHAAASLAAAAGEIMLKVANVAAEHQETQIELRGIKAVTSNATAIVLTSADVDDENTLTEPAKVAPRTRAIPVDGPVFRHTFPANSVTVLRLKLGQ